LDSGDHSVHELGQDKYHGFNLTHGLKALLCLRAIKVSISGFQGNKFNQYPYAFQPSQNDPLLDKFFEATARSRASQKHQYCALFDVCCALTTQGITLGDLTPEALLFYADECRRLNLVVGARPDSNRFAGLLAWEVLHGMGHFPPDTPPTLRTYIYKGQRSPEQMVDFYWVRDPEARQLIIDYVVRREGETDYVTREGLARAIAGEFWSKIEKLAPEQQTLNIPQEVYDQWREVVRLRKDGQPRVDAGSTWTSRVGRWRNPSGGRGGRHLVRSRRRICVALVRVGVGSTNERLIVSGSVNRCCRNSSRTWRSATPACASCSRLLAPRHWVRRSPTMGAPTHG
jgi:hypothetical protein